MFWVVSFCGVSRFSICSVFNIACRLPAVPLPPLDLVDGAVDLDEPLLLDGVDVDEREGVEVVFPPERVVDDGADVEPLERVDVELL